jgi:uncharacterized protein (TIGR03435 family)
MTSKNCGGVVSAIAVGIAMINVVTAFPQTAPKFAVASIKSVSTLSGGLGLACRGADGAKYARNGNGARANADLKSYPVQAAKGRCVGTGTLLSLVEFAYDAVVSDGPEWMRIVPGILIGPNNEVSNANGNLFQIEAVAETPATTTVSELRQMFRTMLADRFKLKVHTETREASGYALVVAKGGSKLVEAKGERLSPFNFIPDPGRLGVKGASTLAELASFITFRDFSTSATVYVADRTGLSGIYEYEFLLPPPGGAAGQRGGATEPGTGLPTVSDLAERYSNVLEAQMGLRLQAQKIPTEFIAIDHAEKPSEN